MAFFSFLSLGHGAAGNPENPERSREQKKNPVQGSFAFSTAQMRFCFPTPVLAGSGIEGL